MTEEVTCWGVHKAVLEMFLENGITCGLCRFFVVQAMQ